MHSTIFTTMVLFFGGALAATKRCTGWGYGTFYNDHACKNNPSVAFSFNNAGCAGNQIGRNSVYVQAPCLTRNGGPSMVWSPGTNCNCQNDCAAVPQNQGCWDLNGHKGASSFRFIEQGCGGNNC